jgi:hypothetical protein
MTAEILIDDDGEPWPLDSPELARRVGCVRAGHGLAALAVAERGFIHIRRIEGGLRVALRPGAFSPVTLAGTLQVLNDFRPRRILLVIGIGDDRVVELFSSICEFVERAEHLASDPPIEVKVPWISVPRGLHNLTTPRFAAARPIVESWRKKRGELSSEGYRAMCRDSTFRRVVLARRLPRSTRLITEYFGAGLEHLRPCEALKTIGRDIHERPDSAYGARVAEAYAEAAESFRPRIDSVQAKVRTSAATTLATRYDRVLLPWRGGGGDVFVMAISIRRKLSVVA